MEKFVVRLRLLFFYFTLKIFWCCPLRADVLCCSAESLVSCITNMCGYQPLLENPKWRDGNSVSLCPSLTCVQTFVSTILNVKSLNQCFVGKVDFFLDKKLPWYFNLLSSKNLRFPTYLEKIILLLHFWCTWEFYSIFRKNWIKYK